MLCSRQNTQCTGCYAADRRHSALDVMQPTEDRALDVTQPAEDTVRWMLCSRPKTQCTGCYAADRRHSALVKSGGRFARPADSALPAELSRLQELNFNIIWLKLPDCWLAVTMHTQGRLSSVSVGFFSSRTAAPSGTDLNVACYTRCPANTTNPPTHILQPLIISSGECS
jgi:hypothetical protein